MNKRDFLKNTMCLVGGVLTTSPVDVLASNQKTYRVKAKAIRNSPFFSNSMEFTYSGDKVNIGDTIIFEEKHDENYPYAFPLVIKYSYKITEINEV